MLTYEEFVKAVKRAYPRAKELHMALIRRRHDDNKLIEKYLRDTSKPISPEHIIKRLNRGRSAKLLAEAKKLLRRQQLYQRWLMYMDGD